MTPKVRQKAESAEDLRRSLAGKLVKRERIRRGKSAAQIADLIGTSLSTYSKVENGHQVGEDTLFAVDLRFEWSGFLDSVLSGSIDNVEALKETGNVDESIRRFAVLRLREIAALGNE